MNESTVVGAVDVFLTMCSLSGVPAPQQTAFDGEDFSAAFRGERQRRTRPLFWEYGRWPAQAKGKGPRGFPYPTEPDAKSPNVAMRDGDWKLLVNADGSGAELYNLATDRNETRNRAAEQPEVLQRLIKAALKWRKSVP